MCRPLYCHTATFGLSELPRPGTERITKLQGGKIHVVPWGLPYGALGIKHFAEDLLRVAMDLQESLVMLERFQAASQSMRLPNKKRRPETGEKSPEIDTITVKSS